MAFVDRDAVLWSIKSHWFYVTVHLTMRSWTNKWNLTVPLIESLLLSLAWLTMTEHELYSHTVSWANLLWFIACSTFPFDTCLMTKWHLVLLGRQCHMNPAGWCMFVFFGVFRQQIWFIFRPLATDEEEDGCCWLWHVRVCAMLVSALQLWVRILWWIFKVSQSR